MGDIVEEGKAGAMLAAGEDMVPTEVGDASVFTFDKTGRLNDIV